MDNTGLAILGASIGGSAKLVQRILGPTADYIGSGIESWTKKRVDNVSRIFRDAEKKLGKKLELDGVVSPRVLKEILQEGSFCDDQLAAEYFGGVLASSRSEIPRDDRGASLARLIGRLTTYQLRSHYLLYRTIKVAFDGQKILINKPEGPGQLATYLPRSAYSAGMDLSPEEDLLVIIGHSLFGLYREGLISMFISTTKEDLSTNYDTNAEEAGIIFQPSALGVELFLWVHGRGDVPVWRFLESDVKLEQDSQLDWSPDFKTLPGRFRTSSPLSQKKTGVRDEY